jgi:hypothetical protein
MDADRELTSAERDAVAALREKARVLYEGKRVAHRSCGIALAETFGVATRPYQALRGGGITGEGPCGAVQAGRLILGEVFGDPDPAGAVTPALRAAITHYEREVVRRLGEAQRASCKALTGRFPVFQSEPRAAFCTGLAAEVAEVLAETIARFGGALGPAVIPER